jgi:hypothetical protein
VEAQVKNWNKERLMLGVLWLLSVAALIVGHNGRFEDTWNRYGAIFSGTLRGG